MKEISSVHINRVNILISFFLGMSIFLFFNFYYPFHVQYQELFQMFLYTSDYFIDRISHPGGLSDYLGNFFIQFYIYSWAGALILSSLLVLLQIMFVWIANRMNKNPACYPLSLLPAIAYWILFCDENYMLSGLISLLLNLFAVILSIKISIRSIRLISCFVAIPILYFFSGGCFWVFVIFVILLEIYYWRERMDSRWWMFVLTSFLLIVFSPLIAKCFYQYPLERLWWGIGFYRFPTIPPYGHFFVCLLLILIPVSTRFFPLLSSMKKYTLAIILQLFLILITGTYLINTAANWDKEEVMGYIHSVQMQQWDRILVMADEKNPTSPISVSCLNLALAKKSVLADKMFSYYQNGVEGLLPTFERDFTSPLSTGEIYYHLGMINTAQRFVFEAMEAIPDYQKSAYCFKRLAETNIINGQYKVAGKYLKMLKQTLFYRSWAMEVLAFLNDEEKINKHPDWGELKRMRFKQDFLFSANERDVMLGLLFQNNKSNRMAFEYLIAYTLLDKNLEHFYRYYPLGRYLGYNHIPKSYQEALLFMWCQNHNPLRERTPWSINPKIIERLQGYAQICIQQKNSEPLLRNDFGDTYWYYLHFRK